MSYCIDLAAVLQFTTAFLVLTISVFAGERFLALEDLRGPNKTKKTDALCFGRRG